MRRAEQKVTNDDLLHYPNQDIIYNAATCITANRPIKNTDEAICLAQSLSNLLFFMQHSSVGGRNKVFDSDQMLEVLSGQEQVLEIATLMSKRLEQYIDIQALQGFAK